MPEATLNRWLKREYESEKVEKLIDKIENGFDCWFTFVIHSGVAPTNNRAERAQIAGHVGKRWIAGTLRNRKGKSIPERIMTVLVPWARAGDSGSPQMRSI